ncbi:hypothetical protein FH972_001083 [Carpinus fangiana]|uniref:Protein FAM33A n=1 Tax=Carpinus fangiana TaxID=176857 RepID=A0A5N6QAN1_9ROSI|nr:hypothetical protein FH972_001083 [Carpinus fangiana]
MGHNNKEHHQATEGLVNLFTKANHDLTVVQHRLEKEFQQVYPDKDLIDKTRTTLVGNISLLQPMQASVGIPLTSDSDDPAFANFNQIVDEWAVQVRSRPGDDERHESDSQDINKLLFLAIVQSN